MAVFGDVLFYNRNRVSLDAVLRHNLDLIAQKVDSIPDAVFKSKNDADIAADLAKSEAIEPIVLDLDGAVPSAQEIDVEVTDQFFGGRSVVRGFRITKRIPFSGDKNLWDYQTNPFDVNPPRGLVEAGHVIFGIELAEAQTDRAKTYIDDYVRSATTYVQWQLAQVQTYNSQIAARAASAIAARRRRISNVSDLLKDL